MTRLEDILLAPVLSYVEDLISDRRVLVLGPLAGQTAARVAPSAREVVVVDPSEPRTRYFRRRWSHPRIRHTVAPLPRTGLPDQSFDVILAQPATADPVALAPLLVEMSRLLQPDGLLVFSFPTRHTPGIFPWRAPSAGEVHAIRSALEERFPHVEILQLAIELCAFVGPDRRRLPTFQVDQVGDQDRFSIPLALCSRLPIVPEEHLLTRYSLAPLATAAHRVAIAARRRIRELSQALEERAGPLEPAAEEDLTGAVLQDEPDQDGIASSRPNAAPPGDADMLAPDSLEPVPDNDETRCEEPAPQDTTGDSSDLMVSETAPEEEITISDTVVDPGESAANQGEQQEGGSAAPDGTSIQDEMPSPTEAPPGALAPPDSSSLQPEGSDVDTGLEETLEPVADMEDPIPPRRRRLEAAMAAPYEVLERHPEGPGAESVEQEEREELPRIPMPTDDIRRAFLDQWEAPDPPAEPRDTGGSSVDETSLDLNPGEPPSPPVERHMDPTESVPPLAELDPVESPEDLLPPPTPRREIRGDAPQLSPRAQRGEAALLQALREERLRSLPSVTELDGSNE